MSVKGWILTLIVGITTALGPPSTHINDGSLKPALDALTRKQRSLDVNPREYYNDLRSFKYRDELGDRKLERERERVGEVGNDNDDLEFLSMGNGQQETTRENFQKILPDGHWVDKLPEHNANNKLLEKVLMDYLENMPQGEPILASSFRERERGGGHKRGINDERPNISDKQLAKLFLKELQDSPLYDQREMLDEDYLDTLQTFYERYKAEQGNKLYGNDLSYAPMSWSDIYAKHDSLRNRNQDEELDEDLDREQNQDIIYLAPAEQRNIHGRFPLGGEYKKFGNLRKRYLVAKRSPKPLQNKRQVTDPKVAQDLGTLFGKQTSDNHNHTHEYHNNDYDNHRNYVHDHEHDQNHVYNQEHGNDQNVGHTSEAPNVTMQSKYLKENITKENKSKERSIAVKKKSVDWSQYFGIDRRKKKATLLAGPETQKEDDEWLLQRYYKTMAENLKPSEQETDKGDEKRDKLQQMDSRLKMLKDMLIEEALRYTGSQDGADLQEVKDKVIARMAAAYSVEKMQKALKEFRSNIAAQRESQRMAAAQNNFTTDYASSAAESGSNDKRNDNTLDEDEGGLYEERSCPEVEAIEKQCKAVEKLAGDKMQILYMPCIMHQICRACEDEDECDGMFAIEATKACDEQDGQLNRETRERCARTALILYQLQPSSTTSALCRSSSTSPSCLRRYLYLYRHRYRYYPYASHHRNGYAVASPLER